MRLTMYTDYGLRALSRLAAEPDRIFTTDEIASEFSISRNHLVKVIRDLASCGILAAQHGTIARGFRLARAPETITIGEIVRLLESRKDPIDCLRTDGETCSPAAKCTLLTKLISAREAFLRELETTMLAECALPPSTDQRDAIGNKPKRDATAHSSTADFI